MMKMKKIINYITILVFWLIAIIVYSNFNDVMFKNAPVPFSWNVATLTWDLDLSIITWNSLDNSWFIVELTDLDLYKKYVTAGNVISFNPPPQPAWNSATYEANTTILNQYLAKNTNYIDITKYSWLKNWWYLYVRTKYTPTDWIFMYWYNAYWVCGRPVSWKLIQSDKYKVSDTEFLYPLDAIELIAYSNKKNCIFNRQEQIRTRKNQYIWWYVASTKWNTIEEISIAWK